VPSAKSKKTTNEQDAEVICEFLNILVAYDGQDIKGLTKELSDAAYDPDHVQTMLAKLIRAGLVEGCVWPTCNDKGEDETVILYTVKNDNMYRIVANTLTK